MRRPKLGLEVDPGAIDDHLSGMLEVHGDLAVDHRLHLPEAPVRPFRMAHQSPLLDLRMPVSAFRCSAVVGRSMVWVMPGSLRGVVINWYRDYRTG